MEGNGASLPRPLPVVVILGATAAGKSAVAERIAAAFPSEIISFDSMKVYRGMDIGTDKPSAGTIARFRYHLVNVKEPEEVCNAGWYVAEAGKAVAAILGRHRLPIVEGGTALYLKAFIQGIFDGPGRDQAYREELLQREAEVGGGTLHKDLASVDPVSAGRLHPHDLKRIVRALEVYRVTGRPISGQQQEWAGDSAREGFHFVLLGVRRDRKEIYRRIDARVDKMMRLGLLEEVKALHSAARLGPTARAALGYRELVDFIEGRTSLEEAVRLAKRNTRHFARRQIGWFAKFPGVTWFDVACDADMDNAAALAVEHIRREILSHAAAWESLVKGG